MNKQSIGEELSVELTRLAREVRDLDERCRFAKIKVAQFGSLSQHMTPETMAALEEFSNNPHAFDVTVAAHYVGNALRAIKWLHDRHINDVDAHNALLAYRCPARLTREEEKMHRPIIADAIRLAREQEIEPSAEIKAEIAYDRVKLWPNRESDTDWMNMLQARNAIPPLLAELRRIRQELEEARAACACCARGAS